MKHPQAMEQSPAASRKDTPARRIFREPRMGPIRATRRMSAYPPCARPAACVDLQSGAREGVQADARGGWLVRG